MRRDVVIVDSEVGKFGRRYEQSLLQLAAEVARALLRRHSQLAARVGVVVAGSGMAARTEGRESGLAQSLQVALGLTDAFGLDVHAFCASGNAAVQTAAMAIEAGRADVALVVGADRATSPTIPVPLVPEAVGAEAGYGYSPPVFYGLAAQQYLSITGASASDLAAIAVRNRELGVRNPKARFAAAVTLEEVLGSPPIAPPLTKLQCCASADGAAALLLAGADTLTPAPRDAVHLVGMGAATNPDPSAVDLLSFAEDRTAADRAYEEAGIGPGDIAVAEVHDAFTISQAIHLEDLGLAERGEGWRAPLPGLSINPSGGLLSRGHPLGATGVAQVDAVARALRAGGGRDDGDGRAARRFGLVQEAGGIQVLGQILSTCLIMELR